MTHLLGAVAALLWMVVVGSSAIRREGLDYRSCWFLVAYLALTFISKMMDWAVAL